MLEATVRTLGNGGASTGERFWLVLASALIYGGIAVRLSTYRSLFSVSNTTTGSQGSL